MKHVSCNPETSFFWDFSDKLTGIPSVSESNSQAWNSVEGHSEEWVLKHMPQEKLLQPVSDSFSLPPPTLEALA